MSGIHQMLLGGGEPTVNPLLSVTCLGDINPGGSSRAEYAFYDLLDPEGRELGSIYRSNFSSTTNTFVQYWLPGSTYAQRQQYEVRGTITYFSNPASSVMINGPFAGDGVWVALPGTFETRIVSTNDDVTYEILFEIRRIGTTNIISSATITFETFGAP